MKNYENHGRSLNNSQLSLLQVLKLKRSKINLMV
jgi:hypothetical protein